MGAQLLGTVLEPIALNSILSAEVWAGPRFARLRKEWLRDNPDAMNGSKLGIRSVRRLGDGDLQVTLVPTDWAQVQSVRRALGEHTLDPCSVQMPAPLTQFEYPNIAVAHCIVRSLDGWILVTRRAASVSYHPGAWSVSYEEGIENGDADPGAPVFERAALRGLAEECFSADAAWLEIRWFRCIAIGIEVDTCNPFVVCRVDLPMPREQIDAMLRPSPEEVAPGGIMWLPARPVRHSGVWRHLLPAGAELHPTSELRLACMSTS
jgi:hypothetical protein